MLTVYWSPKYGKGKTSTNPNRVCTQWMSNEPVLWAYYTKSNSHRVGVIPLIYLVRDEICKIMRRGIKHDY